MTSNSVTSALTWLYVPADQSARIHKALASSADAVIIDLEDGVAAERKVAARDALQELLAGLEPGDRPAIWVRVQPGVAEDLAVAVTAPVAGVCLPKAESAEAVVATADLIADLEATQQCTTPTALMLLVETARGVLHCEQIAQASDRTAILQIGEQDLRADLGLPPQDDAAPAPEPIRLARGMLVLASRAAGLAPPVGPVSLVLRDPDRILADTIDLRASGFGSRAAIHPDQLEPIRSGMMPTAAEVNWAREVLTADTGGVAVVAGRMIDAPVVAQARRIIDIADREAGGTP
jgi:citrate lyase subunit beta/citryl-CoA lyase